MESGVIIGDPAGAGYGFAKGVYNYVCDKERRQFGIRFADIQRKEFRDKEYKLRISYNIRRKRCFYIHDPNKDPKQWVTDLLFILEAMKDSSPSEINVIFPYMRFARQDRKDESRVSVNIKAIADIVSYYADRGLTVDLHAPQIQEYFGIPFDNLESNPVLINYLKEHHLDLLKDLVIVSPDAGGAKRAEGLQKKLGREGIHTDLAICYKRRKAENEVGEIRVMGEVEGKNCLVVDDIIDTGGTLVKTGQVLKERGAKVVYAYGSHGLFTDGIGKFGVFDRILTSDSVITQRGGHFETISLINLFGEAIYRTMVGESLSSLFE
jgi:ribose-phosphate pyrophosphokinase